MISKNQLKLIKGLATKKQRKKTGLFLVQGKKNIIEALESTLVVREVFASDGFINDCSESLEGITVHLATIEELNKASTLATNEDGIAIVEQPQKPFVDSEGLMLALDDINDPGNLGTIIRIADWYGISDILISENTADPYNPKTVSATMGAFARVNLHRTDLIGFLKSTSRPIYGALLDGESVHHTSFEGNAIIVMGNESHGICDDIIELLSKKITIPKFGNSESLNVAMATGIILDNAKRSLS